VYGIPPRLTTSYRGGDSGELQPQTPEWKLVERDAIAGLERVFPFANFTEALDFTNRVGALAEEEGHHPAILTEWAESLSVYGRIRFAACTATTSLSRRRSIR